MKYLRQDHVGCRMRWVFVLDVMFIFYHDRLSLSRFRGNCETFAWTHEIRGDFTLVPLHSSRSVKPTRAARCPCAPPTAKSSVLRQRCTLGSDSTASPMVAQTAAPYREVSLAMALCLHRRRCSRTATRSPTPPQWTVASLEAALASKDVQIVARQPHSTMPPRSREAYLAVARGPSSRTRLVAAPR